MDDHNSPRATRWYEFRDRMIREHASGGCVHFGAGAFGTILAAAFDAGMEAERAARPSVPEEGPEALREALVTLVRRYVREDEEAPGELRWGHHIAEDGTDLGMDPHDFAVEADRLLRALAVPESGGRG
jgi:hypothetical protein